LLLSFSAGLAALAGENYEMLAAVILRPQNKRAMRGKEPLIVSVFPGAVIERDTGRLLPNMARRHTPGSDHLVNVLSYPLREYIPNQLDFEDTFDRLEYLVSMSINDFYLQSSQHPWGPIGRFGWRSELDADQSVARKIQDELQSDGQDWGPLKAGFFGGSIERARTAQGNLATALSKVHW
jgi:hypothetical protein